MFDRRARRLYAPTADRAAALLTAAGIGPWAVTVCALLAGVGMCVSTALGAWTLALGLWLANRLFDGLDGALARQRTPSDLGGMLDFLVDFVVYGGFLVGVAVALPAARLACVVLLFAYLLNVVALLSFAVLIEKRTLALGDERSLRFTPGIAEGAETILAYSAICVVPVHATLIAWILAGMVLVTVGQRVVAAVWVLGLRGAAGELRDVPVKRLGGEL